MQSALERRQAILELLSDRRKETVANLMREFGVSRCTILTDIEVLSLFAPIYVKNAPPAALARQNSLTITEF